MIVLSDSESKYIKQEDDNITPNQKIIQQNTVDAINVKDITE